MTKRKYVKEGMLCLRNHPDIPENRYQGYTPKGRPRCKICGRRAYNKYHETQKNIRKAIKMTATEMRDAESLLVEVYSNLWSAYHNTESETFRTYMSASYRHLMKAITILQKPPGKPRKGYSLRELK